MCYELSHVSCFTGNYHSALSQTWTLYSLLIEQAQLYDVKFLSKTFFLPLAIHRLCHAHVACFHPMAGAKSNLWAIAHVT